MARFDIEAVFKVSGLAQLNASFKQIGSAAGEVRQRFSQFGSDAARFATNIARVGAVTGTALAGAAARFGEFEDQFSKVVTLLDDSSFSTGNFEDNIKGLEQGIIDLRSSTGETFDNLNKGLFDLVSAGVPAERAITSLGVATDLAIAGATETSIAVDGITTTLGAYGDKAGDATAIAQKFFTAQKVGKTDVEQLAGSIGLVASGANAAGVSFDELLASVSAATRTGIRTNAAFTGLRGAIDNIQKPTAAAREEAERLGIQFDATSLRTQGLVGVLQSAANSANFTDESFVRLFGSVEARNFAFAVANDNFSVATGLLSDLNNETKLATQFNAALEGRQDTLGFATQRLLGVFDGLVVKIGGALSPAIKEFFFLLADLITEFQPEIIAFFERIGERALTFVQGLRQNFPETVDLIRSKFGELQVAANAFWQAIQVAFGIVRIVFSEVLSVFDAIAAAIGVEGITGGVLALLAVFLQLSGALSLAFSGTRLFLSGLNLIFTIANNLVIPILIRFGGLLISIGGAFISFIRNVGLLRGALLLLRLSIIALPFIGILVAIAALIDSTIGWERAIEILKETATRVFNFFIEQLANIGKGILGIIEFFAQVAAGIVSIFSPELGQKMSDAIRQAFVNLGEDIKRIFTSIVDFIVGAFNKITSFFTGIFSSSKQAVDQVKQLSAEASKVASTKPQAGSVLDTGGASISVNNQRIPTGFSSGGPVTGAGTATSDSILAKLSRGEYVVNAAAVRRLGLNALHMINRGVLPAIKGFADGGLVDALDRSSSSLRYSSGLQPIGATAGGVATSGRPITLVLPNGGSFQVQATESEADRLTRELRRSDIKRSSNKPRWVS